MVGFWHDDWWVYWTTQAVYSVYTSVFIFFEYRSEGAMMHGSLKKKTWSSLSPVSVLLIRFCVIFIRLPLICTENLPLAAWPYLPSMRPMRTLSLVPLLDDTFLLYPSMMPSVHIESRTKSTRGINNGPPHILLAYPPTPPPPTKRLLSPQTVGPMMTHLISIGSICFIQFPADNAKTLPPFFPMNGSRCNTGSSLPPSPTIARS